MSGIEKALCAAKTEYRPADRIITDQKCKNAKENRTDSDLCGFSMFFHVVIFSSILKKCERS